ncbi:MAG: DNA primase [Acholeplasmatales bacterium]|nr:DNA primase [Acholeplasmatales bacterium]
MQNNYDDTEKIIEATDIVALVSKYVKLEKHGKNYKGLCPFHQEDTPSFVVSPDKKLAHCFGCGGGGNPINFLMQIENVDFPKALEMLASFNGIELKNQSPKKKVEDNNLKYYKIMQVASDFYKKYMDSTNDGKIAYKYLEQRGLDKAIIDTFQIGLAPDIGNTLYQVLKDSDFLELDMADCSLIEKGKNDYYDLFSNRIMFPIKDIDGHVVAFSGRIYKEEDLKNKNQAKYMNSRETKIFHKGEVLFNLNLAKPFIMKRKRVILHEGQMDVIASYRASMEEAVCTMGTALTDYHVKMLSRITNNVVICYDNDKAGIEASKKAIRLFRNHNFNIHLVILDLTKDSDEYVNKYGIDAYYEYFNSNLLDANSYLYQVALMGKNLSDSTVKESVKDEVFSILLEMESNTIQSDYLRLLAKDLNTSLEALTKDFNDYQNTHYKQSVETINYPTFIEEVPYPISIPKQEFNLCEIRLFLFARADKSYAMEIDRRIQEYMSGFSKPMQKLWILLVNSFYDNYSTFDEGAFIKMLDEEEARFYLDLVAYANQGKDKTPYTEQSIMDSIEKLKVLSKKSDNVFLDKRIQTSNSQSEITELINEKIRNKRKQNELNKNRRK